MLTKEQAQFICKNRIDYSVRLALYNGENIECIPVFYEFNGDKLRVAISRDKEIVIRRAIIDSYEELSFRDATRTISFDETTSFSGEFAKKLIIIGAGASFGYSPKLENERKKFQPPLANELFGPQFDEFLNLFHGARNLATSSLHSSDIEAFFQKHWNRLSDYNVHDQPTLRSLINIQYYLSAIFLRISESQVGNRYNYYNQLIQLINAYLSDKKPEEKVLIVSFNYDLLLEEALNTFLRYSFVTVEDYVDIKTRKILLFKPHGSCNWFRSIQSISVPTNYADI